MTGSASSFGCVNAAPPDGISATGGSTVEDRGAEKDQEPEADHELGQRRQDEEDALGRVVERAVAPHGGHGAHDDGDRYRDQGRGEHERQ